MIDSLNRWVIEHKDMIGVLKDFATLGIATVLAAFAARTYIANSKTKRADLIYKLHSDFFGEKAVEYKRVRCVFDSNEESDRFTIQSWVHAEPECFTEYLNFFEMVAYMVRMKQFGLEDATALFGYYFRSLKNDAVTAYIARKDRDYENLRCLLKKIE